MRDCYLTSCITLPRISRNLLRAVTLGPDRGSRDPGFESGCAGALCVWYVNLPVWAGPASAREGGPWVR